MDPIDLAVTKVSHGWSTCRGAVVRPPPGRNRPPTQEERHDLSSQERASAVPGAVRVAGWAPPPGCSTSRAVLASRNTRRAVLGRVRR